MSAPAEPSHLAPTARTLRARPRYVLGLETGGEHLSVGLVRVDPRPELVDEVSVLRENKHADSALALVAAILARHDLTAPELALIGVGRGPGSFTGIRIGLSVALGLGLGADVSLWPVSSLEALALNAQLPGSLVMPLLDARKGEVYGGLYRLGDGPPEVLLAPQAGTCEAVTALGRSRVREVAGPGATPVVLGSGALAYGMATSLPPMAHVARGSMVAWLAAEHWREAGWDVSRAPAVDAAYLRRPEAEIALDGG